MSRRVSLFFLAASDSVPVFCAVRRFAVLLLVTSACGSALPFEPAGPDAAPDPSVMGPYAVGVRTITVRDPLRTVEGTREPVKLTVEVWYPADVEEEGKEVYPFRDFLPPEYHEAADQLGGFETNAVRDAPIVDDEFPVVLFSHGSGGVRVQSTFLTIPLASHGYVVAAPDHNGNTLYDLVEDGDLDLESLGNGLFDRPKDLIATLDGVLDEFEVDEENIGAAGHSFGSVTALRAAALDPRIDAVAAQTPASAGLTWLGIDADPSELAIPIMLQDAGQDRTLPVDENAELLWPSLNRPRAYMSILAGGHFTYSDLCGLDLGVLLAADDLGVGDVLNDGCTEEYVPAEEAHVVIRHFTIGMFNAYLRGSPGARAQLDDAAILGEIASFEDDL